jgi:hypothetical protein
MNRLVPACAFSMTIVMLWLIAFPALAVTGSSPLQNALNDADREFRRIAEIAENGDLPPGRLVQIRDLQERFDKCRDDVAQGKYYSALRGLRDVRAEAEDLREWCNQNQEAHSIASLGEALMTLISGILAIVAFFLVLGLISSGCNAVFGADETLVDREEAKQVLDVMPGYWDALCTLKETP